MSYKVLYYEYQATVTTVMLSVCHNNIRHSGTTSLRVSVFFRRFAIVVSCVYVMITGMHCEHYYTLYSRN